MTTSTEWLDVPVAEVAVGDECRVNGYGRGQGNTLVDVGGKLWYLAYSMTPETIWLQDVAGIAMVDFRRSSIVAVRRRKPEPQPKPGDWRCRVPGTCPECLAACGCISREVFRAAGGWSRDTRTGQPWVMQEGDPVEVVVKATADTVRKRLDGSVWIGGSNRLNTESWADYYKRIGLDVRPVERRKR